MPALAALPPVPYGAVYFRKRNPPDYWPLHCDFHSVHQVFRACLTAAGRPSPKNGKWSR